MNPFKIKTPRRQVQINKYGLRISHVRGALRNISNDLTASRPEEIKRRLLKLAEELEVK